MSRFKVLVQVVKKSRINDHLETYIISNLSEKKIKINDSLETYIISNLSEKRRFSIFFLFL